MYMVELQPRTLKVVGSSPIRGSNFSVAVVGFDVYVFVLSFSSVWVFIMYDRLGWIKAIMVFNASEPNHTQYHTAPLIVIRLWFSCQYAHYIYSRGTVLLQYGTLTLTHATVVGWEQIQGNK